MSEDTARYSIHEFSEITGLPQSKIRYYEKLGLFSGRRQENGYRVYTLADSIRASAFRNLLLYGFSVEQAIQMLDEKQNSTRFTQSLQEKRTELEHQRQLLDYRLHALNRSLRFLQELPENDDFTIQDREDLLYVEAPTDREQTGSAESGRAFTRFTDMLGISRFAKLLSAEALEGVGPLRPRFVSCIPQSEGWRLGSPSTEHVRRLSMGKCLMFHRTLNRYESNQTENFDSMKRWLAEHGYRIRGLVVIHPTFLNLDGDGRDIETVIVPIS